MCGGQQEVCPSIDGEVGQDDNLCGGGVRATEGLVLKLAFN